MIQETADTSILSDLGQVIVPPVVAMEFSAIATIDQPAGTRIAAGSITIVIETQQLHTHRAAVQLFDALARQARMELNTAIAEVGQC